MGREEARFLPLSSMRVDAKLDDSIAVVRMIQEYYNPGILDGRPLEVQFKFPKEPNTILSQMMLKVGE